MASYLRSRACAVMEGVIHVNHLGGVINDNTIFANSSKNFIDWFHQRRGPQENILIREVPSADQIFMQGSLPLAVFGLPRPTRRANTGLRGRRLR